MACRLRTSTSYRSSAARSTAATVAMAALRLTTAAWPKLALPACRPMGVTAAAVRATAVLVAVAARPATERMAAVDNRAGVKVVRTALLTVAQVSVVSVVSVVLVVSAATLWCLKPAKTRFPWALPAEQVSRASQGVAVAVVAVGLVRCFWPVVAVAAQALVVPQAVERLVVVVAADRSASMLLVSTAW